MKSIIIIYCYSCNTEVALEQVRDKLLCPWCGKDHTASVKG